MGKLSNSTRRIGMLFTYSWLHMYYYDLAMNSFWNVKILYVKGPVTQITNFSHKPCSCAKIVDIHPKTSASTPIMKVNRI